MGKSDDFLAVDPSWAFYNYYQVLCANTFPWKVALDRTRIIFPKDLKEKLIELGGVKQIKFQDPPRLIDFLDTTPGPKECLCFMFLGYGKFITLVTYEMMPWYLVRCQQVFGMKERQLGQAMDDRKSVVIHDGTRRIDLPTYWFDLLGFPKDKSKEKLVILPKYDIIKGRPGKRLCIVWLEIWKDDAEFQKMDFESRVGRYQTRKNPVSP